MIRRRELVDRPYYANRARRNRSFSQIVRRARTYVGFLAEFVFMHCRHVLTDVVVGFCSFCIDIIENKHGVTSVHVDLEFLQNKQKGTQWDFNCFSLFASFHRCFKNKLVFVCYFYITGQCQYVKKIIQRENIKLQQCSQ